MVNTKIVILDGYTLNPGDLHWSALEKLGECTIYDRTPEQLIVERTQNADVIFTNKTVLKAETLKQLPNLRYIGVLATGYDVVDIHFASSRNITVTNVPGYSAPSVAQAVFSLILATTNRVFEHNSSVKEGDWCINEDFCYQKAPLSELLGKTLGIVGYGSIGKNVAKIGEAFGMRIIAHTRTIPEGQSNTVKFVPLDDLLTQSDYISLHCPLTEKTLNLICKDSLAKMSPHAHLINTSRGPLINEADLASALQTGAIAGAALDVLAQEPPDKNNPLLALPNCIITPHIAWATKEARTRLLDIATNNLSRHLSGATINQVN